MTNVIPQTEDFSCGAAALATLLRYHFGNHLTERKVILGMFEQGDKEQIRKVGFSMLEMKQFCEQLQYQGQGYKIDLQKLRQINIPVITLMDTRSYKHFVVIRRVDDRFVYIADPSFGNRRIPLADFEASWNRVIFVVTGAVSGQPEGLYAEKDRFNLPKYEALEAANIWQRAAMDPSMSLLWTAHGGISLVSIINGTFN
ncbi:MAG: C39 family peptidase [Syntrophobacterales bacterium]|nr:C39 family peptidase [Syntrophobacterales bacterium]